MANYIQVVRNCTLTDSRYGSHSFTTGDQVDPSSPWYFNLLWTGNATDTGNPAPGGTAPQVPIPLDYVGMTGATAVVPVWDPVDQRWELVDITTLQGSPSSPPDLSNYQTLSLKGQPNGYGSLDASGKQPGSQVNFGTAVGTVAQGNDARLSDKRTPLDGSVGDTQISSSGIDASHINNLSTSVGGTTNADALVHYDTTNNVWPARNSATSSSTRRVQWLPS